MPKYSDLYPQYLMPVAGYHARGADDFDLTREALLVNYGLATARCYWGDLDHWRDWCSDHQQLIDPLHPVTAVINEYLTEMLTLGYSRNTVARRMTTLRAFFDLVPGPNPTDGVPPIRRRDVRDCSGSQCGPSEGQ